MTSHHMKRGRVDIGLQSHDVWMSPQWNKHGLSLCNFRSELAPHRIYTEGGPHVSVYVPAKDLLSSLSANKTVALHASYSSACGKLEMLTGHPAVDEGHGKRSISSLTVSVARLGNSTKFSLSGMASEPLDINSSTGARLESRAVPFAFEFDVDDGEIPDFLPDSDDRDQFLLLIRDAA